MDNLKPCPFCGGEPKLMQAWVECKKCRAMAAVSGARNDAISAWNRRFGSGIDVGGTEDGWIPVTERLPDEGDTVLMWHKDGFVMLAVNMFDEMDNVTHWMPLPAPPEGGKS